MSHYALIKDGTGQGGFMAPPGDPAHTHMIRETSNNRSNAREVGAYSIDSDADWIPAHIRDQAARVMASANRTESDLWVRNVYGYFRNMWSPDGRTSNVSSLVSVRPDNCPDDWHAAVIHIRRYFPDHTPRADLITDPGKGYGSWPCRKCGARVQYEARYDALTEVSTRTTGYGGTSWTYKPECEHGGAHEV